MFICFDLGKYNVWRVFIQAAPDLFSEISCIKISTCWETRTYATVPSIDKITQIAANPNEIYIHILYNKHVLYIEINLCGFMACCFRTAPSTRLNPKVKIRVRTRKPNGSVSLSPLPLPLSFASAPASLHLPWI